MATIGLCMIVKDEAEVITRCIESVRRLIDFVMIEDTGSSDGTQELVRKYIARIGLPGEVVDESWQDFASNRSSALAHLRKHAEIDYALSIDADEQIIYDEGFDAEAFKAGMDKDLYDVRIEHTGYRFSRALICRNRTNFRYRGVVHEFIEPPPGPISRETVRGFHILSSTDGARSKRGDRSQRDARILEQALASERDEFLIARYTFYLAQSYRNSGEIEKALKTYLARAKLGYWQEEVFYSLYAGAQLKEQFGLPEQEVVDAYLEAAGAMPTRAEPLHGASRFCRTKGRYEEGFQLARRGLAICRPPDGMYMESWIYDYGLLDELAVNAYWSGHYRESLDACVKALASPACPPDWRERIAANARFPLEKLQHDLDLGSLGSEGGLIEQHALVSPRRLRSRVVGAPRVLVAILAKQKEPSLPLYLECIEALDYPKSSIVLYIRTNNNTDRTEAILREWVGRVGHLYAGVEFDAEDVDDPVQQFRVHEWNATRFRVLGRIRNISLRRALELECEFYFTADVDNFIRPCTLRELVALNMPIVAPFLRAINPRAPWSNFHSEVNNWGGYRHSDQYTWVVNRFVRGLIEMPVVHTTYLVRADVIPELTYEDTRRGEHRYEYVVFSESARKAAIPQYLDNRQVYGYLTWDKDTDLLPWETPGYLHVEHGIERAAELLRPEFDTGARNAGIKLPERENRPEGTVVQTKINGQQISFFVTNSNDLIMNCHYQGAFYEMGELDMIKRHYTQGGTFVDIGANFGNHAVYISRFTRASRIIVFEPNQAAISILKENLLLNQCNNVDTRFLGIALSGKKSRLRQSTPDPNNLGWTYYTEDASGDVQGVNGDALILDEPVEFIKIDVEGMEIEILSGLQRTIRRWRPTIFIEVWDSKVAERWASASQGAGQVEALLAWCARESYEIVERSQLHEGIWNFLIKSIYCRA